MFPTRSIPLCEQTPRCGLPSHLLLSINRVAASAHRMQKLREPQQKNQGWLMAIRLLATVCHFSHRK